TLMRMHDGGWRADCTDVDGVIGALRCVEYRPSPGKGALVLGAGGTAPAVLAALAELRIDRVVLLVRDPTRAVETIDCAERVDLPVQVVRWDSDELSTIVNEVDLVVSTVPAGGADALAETFAQVPTVLDVVYHPWPTPLADAVIKRGGNIA